MRLFLNTAMLHHPLQEHHCQPNILLRKNQERMANCPKTNPTDWQVSFLVNFRFPLFWHSPQSPNRNECPHCRHSRCHRQPHYALHWKVLVPLLHHVGQWHQVIQNGNQQQQLHFTSNNRPPCAWLLPLCLKPCLSFAGWAMFGWHPHWHFY